MASEKNSADYMMDDLHISDTVDLLIARKDEISIRFSVEVRIEKPAESFDDGCWVNILGQEAKVKAAKQYIKNLCNPEVTETVNYPAEFHSRISDKAVVFELEKKYRAVVQFNDGENPEDDGEAVVRGDGLAVALTLSAIEDRITTYMEQSRLSMGDLTADTTSGHSSYPHTSGYSDNTSHRLNDTLKGMSGQLSLTKDHVDGYPDVMKKLILDWASEETTNDKEAITLDDSDEDNTMAGEGQGHRSGSGSESDIEEEGVIDRTIQSRLTPSRPGVTPSRPGVTPSRPGIRDGPQTSTPYVPDQSRSYSGIKVEKLTAPSPLTDPGRTSDKPAPAPRAGKMYVDLTESTLSSHTPTTSSSRGSSQPVPARRGGAADAPPQYCLSSDEGGSTSDDDETPITRPSTFSVPVYKRVSTGGNISPTSQTQKDISTITLSDDTTSDDITVSPDDITVSPDVIHLAPYSDSPPDSKGGAHWVTDSPNPTKRTIQKTPDTVDASSSLTERLVNGATGRGYDEVEIAQALSLCEGDLSEQKFTSALNKVRNSPIGEQHDMTTKQKRKRNKQRTNTALDNLPKHEGSRSPPSVGSSPYEKKVRTRPTSPPWTGTGYNPARTTPPQTSRVPPPNYNPNLYNPAVSAVPMETQPIPQLMQLQQYRAGQSQSYHHQQQQQQQPATVIRSQPPPPPPPATVIPQHIPYNLPSTSGYDPPPPPQPPLPPLPHTELELPPMPGRPDLPKSGGAKCRMVVIDGSNIAYHHGDQLYPGKDKIFSSKGILIAINFLKEKYGHTHETLKAIVPRYRVTDRYTRDGHLLNKMEESGFLNFSPCKNLGGKRIVPYDDRFILDIAVQTDGVVISNDKYADLMTEQKHKYEDVIRNRVIMFMFVGDMFMIPEDPMGIRGPTLAELLRPAGQTKYGHTLSAPQHAPLYRQPGNRYPPQPSYPTARNPTSLPSHHITSNPRSNQPYTTSNRYQALATRQRSETETNQMVEQLSGIFPDTSPEQIRARLRRHPFETDVNIFVEHFLDS